MSEQSCKAFRELLVDYADRALSEAESGHLAGHVEHCDACRGELAALERSLEVARNIWRELAEDAPTLPAGGMPAKRRWRAALTVAAATVAGIAALGGWWFAVRIGDETQAGSGGAVVEIAVEEAEDVLAMIEREARIARLAASAEILGSDPALKPYQERADRYLLEAYGYRRPDG